MKRILIIRPSAMGDIVMASPMICALRTRYPEARIAWLAEPSFADLLRHHPDLDEVIPWPKEEWRQDLRGGRLFTLTRRMSVFAQELRRRRFDLALDTAGLFKTRWLAWLSGARERIGFASKEPGRFLMTRLVPKGGNIRWMSSEYRFLMETLQVDPGRFAPQIAVSGDERARVREVLQDAGVLGEFALIAPFTTRPQKHWFEERWAELAREIRSRLDLPVLALGAPSDREGGARLQSLSEGAIIDLTGRTTLGQTAALIRESALLIGVDTGLTHMGTAFERPTVALFGATCPYLETPSPLTRVLYHPHRCSPCHRKPTCNEAVFHCMRSIAVEEVRKTAEDLIKANR